MMGQMKDLHITIYNGGDEAVAAVERIGKAWREQLDQAADEIERLRADLSRAGQIAAGGEKRTVRESVSEIDQMRHVSETCRDTEPMPRGNRAEVSLTLTDAEREAIRFAAVLYERGERPADAATLRGLLERTERIEKPTESEGLRI